MDIGHLVPVLNKAFAKSEKRKTRKDEWFDGGSLLPALLDCYDIPFHFCCMYINRLIRFVVLRFLIFIPFDLSISFLSMLKYFSCLTCSVLKKLLLILLI